MLTVLDLGCWRLRAGIACALLVVVGAVPGTFIASGTAQGKEAGAAGQRSKSSKSTAKKSQEPVTYTKDIASILWNNCAGCHRPGEVGPFPLLTYEDAAKRAEFIADITASGQMPPWKAESGFGKFLDERHLTDEELEKLIQWAEAGAPEGDSKDLPEPPKFHEGWQLGEPDLVLQLPEPFAVPADGRDIYRCFVIPIPADKDKMVSAVEFRPGNRSVVHHAILFLDANGVARKMDGRDGKPGFATFGGPGILPTGGLGSWAPGAMPRFLPEGVVKYVKKGSDLVLQLHYHPSGKPETDQSMVGIHFSKTPFKKIVTGIAVLQTDLKIPANNANFEVRAESEALPADVNVLGVSPHMHNLGKEFKVTAVRPGRDKEVPLIWIKDWDFNWQGGYQFEKPVFLPKGSVIKVFATYDNSAENPKNPNHPPKDVGWGEQTTDEMCLCGVQVTTERYGDMRLIAKMRGHELAAGLEGGVPGQAETIRKKIAERTVAAKKAAKADDAKGEKKVDEKAELAEKGSDQPLSRREMLQQRTRAGKLAEAKKRLAASKGETSDAATPEGSAGDKPADAPAADPAAPPAKPAGEDLVSKFPIEGILLEGEAVRLTGFDENRDGKISREEFAKLPANIQEIVISKLPELKKAPS